MGIICADSIVVDQELSTETEIEQRSIRVSHAHLTLREHAPDPLNALYFAQNIVKTYPCCALASAMSWLCHCNHDQWPVEVSVKLVMTYGGEY